MRIVATADLHGHLPTIPECDVLVIAGDVCPASDHSIVFQKSWVETNFRAWLKSVPAKHIIGIGGNHDFIFECNPGVARKLPWTYLLDEGVEIDGVKFWGAPWVPNLSLWAFHLDDPRLDEHFGMVPDATDVLIVHGPPYMYSDHTCPKYGNVYAGYPGMLDVLERVNPGLYICGHIHEAYGWSYFHDTLIINAAHQTENYEPMNDPVELLCGPEYFELMYSLAPSRTNY